VLHAVLHAVLCCAACCAVLHAVLPTHPPTHRPSARKPPSQPQERDMCAEPASAHPFQLYLHRAVMTHLAPDSRYRYRITGGDATWPFRSPPVRHASFKFVAFGDLGDPGHPEAAKSPGAAATIGRIVNEDVEWLDLVLHVGGAVGCWPGLAGAAWSDVSCPRMSCYVTLALLLPSAYPTPLLVDYPG